MSSHRDTDSEPEEVPSDDEIALPPPVVVPEPPLPRRSVVIREISPEDRLPGQDPILYRKKENGVLKCKSARKTPRLPDKRKLCDRDVEDVGEATSPPPTRKKLDFYVLDISLKLKKWRGTNHIPSTYEVGETSATPPPLLTTEEPLELTIPTLVDRIAFHDRQLEAIHERIRETRAGLKSLRDSAIRRLSDDMHETMERLDLVEDVVGEIRRGSYRDLENMRDELVLRINAEVEEMDGRMVAMEEMLRTLREDWDALSRRVGGSMGTLAEDVETLRRMTTEQLGMIGAEIRSTQKSVDGLSCHLDVDCHALAEMRDRVAELERRAASAVMLTVMSTAVAGLAVLFGLFSHFTR